MSARESAGESQVGLQFFRLSATPDAPELQRCSSASSRV